MSTTGTYAPSDITSDNELNDYDIISSGHRSIESSVADLDASTHFFPREIPPTPAAREQFDAAGWSAEDIQGFVRRSLGRERDWSSGDQMVRVYVDGVFDLVHAGDALRLRQAKLSFPSVRLLIGAFPDSQCQLHNVNPLIPHTERCELLRHIRWVDEVIPDAPYVLDESFLTRHRIDYVAIEEGSSVDPAIDKARLSGYDLVKSLGKAISTRRTRGLAGPALSTKLATTSSGTPPGPGPPPISSPSPVPPFSKLTLRSSTPPIPSPPIDPFTI